MSDREDARRSMVELQLAARDVSSDEVLDAMGEVPREAFVPPEMVEFAYEDAALPIAEGQTISQPYIVAVMAQALEISPEDRVLDVGTGSGYAAAVLSRVAAEVYTVERHRALAEAARRRFEELGYDNIHVLVGDGTLGWEAEAPFDAIQVAAGGPEVPRALREQLAPGGRLVIPVGREKSVQELLRVRRVGDGFEEDRMGAVRFVPLVGTGGWAPEEGDAGHVGPSDAASRSEGRTGSGSLENRVAAAAEPLDGIDDADVDAFLDRVGDARLVLLGEASHGTSEFYRLRARMTKRLIQEKDVDFVAVEADWPDAAVLDRYVRHEGGAPPERMPFTRFPTWMWANEEVRDFIEWLRAHNEGLPPDERVGFHGLDLYSLFHSIEAVLDYLDDVDPDAAETARTRYGCLTPYQDDPATYGRAVVTGRYQACEDDVVEILRDLLAKRMAYLSRDGTRRHFDAEQNARVVANAERYYRIMYSGGAASWNLRDRHMFGTLQALLDERGRNSKAVVWEHNSHLGDARATEMSARGQTNVGALTRERFGSAAYLVGFGTHTGTVAAAHDWGEPMEVMDVNPSREASYERLAHGTGIPRFLLPLQEEHTDPGLLRELREERLERAIGVIYRPRTERTSHYFHASLPRQFDEYAWIDETTAVTPLERAEGASLEEGEVPETFPFAV